MNFFWPPLPREMTTIYLTGAAPGRQQKNAYGVPRFLPNRVSTAIFRLYQTKCGKGLSFGYTQDRFCAGQAGQVRIIDYLGACG